MHPANIEEDKERMVDIVYDNDGLMHRLTIIPHTLTFGRSIFNEQPQWLLTATDVNLNLVKVFRMAYIREWNV